MKKIFIFILCAALFMSVAGCGSSLQSKEADQQANEVENQSLSEGENLQTTDESGTPAQNDGKQNANTAGVKGPDEIVFKIDSKNKLEFAANTLEGEVADSSIFKDYKLTMINIWGTSCKPCIGEMPDLQEVYEEMKPEGVNVIGFVANSLTDTVDNAKEILKEKGVTYTNIAFFTNEETANRIAKQSGGFPGTIFVDSKGNIVGKQISGIRSTEEYKKEIKDRLEGLAN